MDPRLIALLTKFGLRTDALPTEADVAALATDQRAALNVELEALNATVLLEQLDAVTADSAPATPTPTRIATRRPTSTQPTQRASTQVALTASGRTLAPADLQTEFLNALSRVRGSNAAGRWPIASATWVDAYGDARTLGPDPVANAARIAAVAGPAALIASGGVCAPTPVRYELSTLADPDSRPVKDALPAFAATRGGVTVLSPYTVRGAASGVGVWTNGVDTAPGGNTKNRITHACPSETEYLVDAITMRARIGNYSRMFAGEIVASFMATLTAAHSRLAEMTLLSQMETGSTATTAGTTLGAARDVLAVADRASAGQRARLRLPEYARLRLIAPSWLRDMIRTDLARELPGSSEERLAVADAAIDEFFAARRITPTWSLDYQSESWGTQLDGALAGWPSHVKILVFPEGSWLFLDGGTLDLGVYRDSSLVGTNDTEAFLETFEQVALTGPESLLVDCDVCPDGSTSATVDIAPCTTGS